MSYLIFCSFEVGGLPFRMADILNRHGLPTYYVSVHKDASGHDSTAFHHELINTSWNLTDQFKGILDSDEGIIDKLKVIKQQYDIKGCLTTGTKSFLLASAGINYQYWSFGADLDQICFYKKWPDYYGLIEKLKSVLIPSRYMERQAIQKLQSEQVKSILDSRTIIISPYQIDSYMKICPGKTKSFFPHFFPESDYEVIAAQKLINKSIVKETIGTDKFFFSSTRHFWYGDSQSYSDNKGNDIIFHSFAKYLQLTSDIDTKLVLIAKGQDVGASVELTRKLGLSDRVVWVDEMTRDKLRTYYSAAHVVFGQFGTPVLAFSALEPLTEGTPCISFFLDGREQGVPFYENFPPILNTKDTLLIAEHLARLMANHEEYKTASYKAWQWIQDNCLENNFARSINSIFTKYI